MLKNFPPKYYIIFTDDPEKEIHRNRIIAGLRVALTLLMEEYEVQVLLLQESITIAKKQNDGKIESSDDDVDDDINFTPQELLEGLISFGGSVMTCKSSLSMMDLTEDDLIDGLYNQVFRELITYMIADPSTIDRANYLLWAAHNLERAADRVTNICERTIYVATGKMIEIKISDDEQVKIDLRKPAGRYEP